MWGPEGEESGEGKDEPYGQDEHAQ